jgi:hypothetical protein
LPKRNVDVISDQWKGGSSFACLRDTRDRHSSVRLFCWNILLSFWSANLSFK